MLVFAVTQSIAASPGALLIAATKRGDLKMVQYLLRQGGEPNAHDTVHKHATYLCCP